MVSGLFEQSKIPHIHTDTINQTQTMNTRTLQRSQEFRIAAKQTDKALEKLTQSIEEGEVSPRLLDEDEAEFECLDEALDCFGWETYRGASQSHNDIIEVDLMDGVETGEVDEILWDILAEYVDKTSYIELHDENETWRYVFGDNEMEVVYATFNDPFEGEDPLFLDEKDELYGYAVFNVHHNCFVEKLGGHTETAVFDKEGALEYFDEIDVESKSHLRIVRVVLDNEVDKQAVGLSDTTDEGTEAPTL